MLLVAFCLLVPGNLAADRARMAGDSFLYRPAFSMDYTLREPAVPYAPQPGDIFLCTGREFWAKGGHRLAFTAAPQHSGILFRQPDGQMALLEGGPQNTFHCHSLDLIPELQAYATHERIWIRQRAVPLTQEQSRQLTVFAMASDGKRFAFLRMLAQITPLRSRGPLRTWFLGRSHGDRHSYFCSELVAEACVAAGLLDKNTARPSATYPRDLFFGRSRNLYLDRHLDLSQWAPPARWTTQPGMEKTIPRRPWLDRDTDRP